MYSPPDFIRLVKPRKTRLLEHVVHLGVRERMYRVLVANVRERDYLKT